LTLGDGFGRFDHEIFGGVTHQVQPELGPTLFSLGRDVRIVLGGDEEKIVLDDLVKMRAASWAAFLTNSRSLGLV